MNWPLFVSEMKINGVTVLQCLCHTSHVLTTVMIENCVLLQVTKPKPNHNPIVSTC